MKVVIGQGSCGIASGAKKTESEFRKQLVERDLKNVTLDKTGCIGTCYLEPIVDVYGDDTVERCVCEGAAGPCVRDRGGASDRRNAEGRNI